MPKTYTQSQKNRHLFIDGREANTLQRVGSNVYAFQIIWGLYKKWMQATQNEGQDKDIEVTIGLASEPVADMPPATNRWHYEIITPTFFWTQWALPLHLYRNRKKYSIVYTPSHYAPRMSPIPTVITIFDLAFLTFPAQFKKKDYLQLKEWTAYSAKQANHIITISNYSKKSIIDTYKKASKDITIAFPAVADSEAQICKMMSIADSKKILHEHSITGPFLLYLGTIQPRKNIIQMIEAFEQLKRQIGARSLAISPKKYQQLDSLQFVIAGKVGWLAEPIMDRIAQSPYASDILVTGFVDDQTKWALLKQAEVSFQLGTHEGFGIPALESCLAGSLVIASNNASLPEVVGDGGFLVKHNSQYSLQTALKKAISLTAKERAKKIKKAKEQASTFSWEHSADVVAEVLLSINNKK